MADDLDAELLALAGDSSDEAPPAQKEKAASLSSSHSPHRSSTMVRKDTATRVKPNRKPRKKAARVESDDEDMSVLRRKASAQCAC